MQLIFNADTYICDKAVKGRDSIHLYKDGVCISEFLGITDFSGYVLDGGEWSEPDPSTEEVLLEIAADHEERLCMMELGI